MHAGEKWKWSTDREQLTPIRTDAVVISKVPGRSGHDAKADRVLKTYSHVDGHIF